LLILTQTSIKIKKYKHTSATTPVFSIVINNNNINYK